MTGRIRIEDLRLRATIGVHERERRAKQELVVGLDLETDLDAAGRTDDIAESTDYEALVQVVARCVEESSFQLVEALASAVADLVLARFPRVDAATVTVAKPGALAPARVSVILRRARG